MNFELKDNGQRQEFASGMVREPETDKMRYDLAFDGPMVWALLADLDPCNGVAQAAKDWYEFGGVTNATRLIVCLCARETLSYWQLVDRYTVLMMKGAIKYSDRNWLKAAGEEELKRFIASFSRHLVKYLRGDKDEDHLAALFFNINGAEYVRAKLKAHEELPF